MHRPDVWGDDETRFFYTLTPDRILDAVERAGYACTGRCLALNSLENRVYEVEIETDAPPVSPSDRFVVVKFYRPGRWTADQILDEHDFLLDLEAQGLPVVAPWDVDDNGATLARVEGLEMHYAIFPKRGGRIPDEVDPALASRLGGLLARVHNVGAECSAEHRLRLDPETYGLANLQHLLETDAIAPHVRGRYRQTVEAICAISAPWFAAVPVQRIHGDCHLGNVLQHPDEGLRLVDFDDMAMGPCVQDLWLLAAGRCNVDNALWRSALAGYSEFRDFPVDSTRLAEPLRALRFVHFSAWISRRWSDPAFPDAFPTFGSDRYWEEQLADLQDQLALIQEI